MRKLAFVLGLVAMSAAPAAAQIPLLDIRVGAQAAMPTGDMGDLYKGGFGAYGRLGLPTGPIKLMGTATWTRFPGKTVDVLGVPVGIPDIDAIGLTVGPHLKVPFVDAGVEFGYFSGDQLDKMGIVPSVSIGLLKFDFMASYTMVSTDPKKNWLAVGAGLRF